MEKRLYANAYAYAGCLLWCCMYNKSYSIVKSAAGFFLMALVSHQLVWVDCLHPKPFLFFFSSSFLLFFFPSMTELVDKWMTNNCGP